MRTAPLPRVRTAVSPAGSSSARIRPPRAPPTPTPGGRGRRVRRGRRESCPATPGPQTQLSNALLPGRQPDRAADAGLAQAAIAVRVLREVLLVVVLGVEEVAGRADLSCDLAVARIAELLL